MRRSMNLEHSQQSSTHSNRTNLCVDQSCAHAEYDSTFYGIISEATEEQLAQILEPKATDWRHLGLNAHTSTQANP